MVACNDCYQDYLIIEQVIEISTKSDAQQIIEKISAWLELMREHGDRFNVEKIHNDYFKEVEYYEDKVKELNANLSEAQETDDAIKYSLIKILGIKILKDLMVSNVMRCYSTHLAQTQASIRMNKVRRNNLRHLLIL